MVMTGPCGWGSSDGGPGRHAAVLAFLSSFGVEGGENGGALFFYKSSNSTHVG